MLDEASMRRTAEALVAPGKGILAADESTPTMARRLAGIGVESTEDTRRAYREILLATPGIGEHISGVILFDETIRQHTSAGLGFADLLTRAGVIPGIKVDRGTVPLAGWPDETITEGLDGLRHRLDEYLSMGARFSKWRAVISIGGRRPTAAAVEANAHALARFAALSQESGLVPIVEPEVLMDGDHSIQTAALVTAEVLRSVYEQLSRQGVALDASLLKPNMVLPGKDCPRRAAPAEIAEATTAVLRATVPPEVPGIVFLSGGQTDLESTWRLDALNRTGAQPWQLSFSFGRALQAPVLAAWAGSESNRAAAQAALAHRAAMNGAARFGRYTPDLEEQTGTASDLSAAGASVGAVSA